MHADAHRRDEVRTFAKEIGKKTHPVVPADVGVNGYGIDELDSEVLEYLGRIVTAATMPTNGMDRVGLRSETSATSVEVLQQAGVPAGCLLYTSPSPRDGLLSRMPSSA